MHVIIEKKWNIPSIGVANCDEETRNTDAKGKTDLENLIW